MILISAIIGYQPRASYLRDTEKVAWFEQALSAAVWEPMWFYTNIVVPWIFFVTMVTYKLYSDELPYTARNNI